MPATAYMQRRGVRRASRGARAAGAFARASLALLLFTAAAPGATAASRAPRHRIGEPVAAAAGVGAGPAAASSGGGGGLNASAAEPAAPLRWPWGPTADPVANVLALADCLYNRNNVSCIAAFCRCVAPGGSQTHACIRRCARAPMHACAHSMQSMQLCALS